MACSFLYRGCSALLLGLLAAPLSAQMLPVQNGGHAQTGSAAFCLFEIAPDTERRLWLNLGIVQYLEWRPNELRIFYGGGNLGSGHEYRLAAGKEEARAFIEKMQAAAALCANGRLSVPPDPPTSGN
ncbi:MAG TPA: hypothetical protein VFK74_09305 [Azospira sp.]|nr:hypothetical protein [Azospira sp.]